MAIDPDVQVLLDAVHARGHAFQDPPLSFRQLNLPGKLSASLAEQGSQVLQLLNRLEDGLTSVHTHIVYHVNYLSSELLR